MQILLDAGHGGADPGAVAHFSGVTCGGLRESDVVLGVVRQLGGILSWHQWLVSYTRMENQAVALERRCEEANQLGVDVFVSIHCNSFADPAAHGYEVWTSPVADAADALATQMYGDYRATFPDMRGRADFSDGDPDKQSKFWVLVHTEMPAVLFELAFISNLYDARRLVDPVWLNRAAWSLARSIIKWGER
jgi:N-acetylmuramoyl-L-alanine amidase